MEVQPGPHTSEKRRGGLQLSIGNMLVFCDNFGHWFHRMVEVFQRLLQFFSASVSSLQTSFVPLGRHRSCIGERGRRFQNLGRERRRTSLAEQVAVQFCSGLFHKTNPALVGPCLGLAFAKRAVAGQAEGGLHEDHPVRDELFEKVPHFGLAKGHINTHRGKSHCRGAGRCGPE